MRTITVFTAPWYPGHSTLMDVVETAREKLEGKDVTLDVKDVDEDLSDAESNQVVTVPTAVLFKDDQERRRVTGAVGMVELLGLAGVRTRARKPQRS